MLENLQKKIAESSKMAEATAAQARGLVFYADSAGLSVLVSIVKSGKARERLNIHDVIAVGGNEFEIIGFDHDKVTDVPEIHTITLMGLALLPARRMYSTACETGWIDSELRSWLNEDYYCGLPEELTAHIRETQKMTYSCTGNPTVTNDKLFIPSESEMFGSAIYCNYEEGQRYEAFATSEDRIRTKQDGSAGWYWTRSCACGDSESFCVVDDSGIDYYYTTSFDAIQVPLCFVVA